MKNIHVASYVLHRTLMETSAWKYAAVVRMLTD